MEDNREKRRLEETCASDICAYRGHGVCDFTEGMFCPMYIPKTEEVDNVIKESKSVRFPEKHDDADSCSAGSGLIESDFGDKYMTACGKQALFIREEHDRVWECDEISLWDFDVYYATIAEIQLFKSVFKKNIEEIKRVRIEENIK